MPSDPSPQTCNIAAYLSEQERDCLRLARVTGTHTNTGEEWSRLAYNMVRMQQTHAETCKKCRGTR